MPDAAEAAAPLTGTQGQALEGAPAGQGDPSAELIAKVRAAIVPEWEQKLAAKEAELHGAQTALGRLRVAQGLDQEQFKAALAIMNDREAAIADAKAAGVPDRFLTSAITAAQVRDATSDWQGSPAARQQPPAAVAPPQDALQAAIAKALKDMGMAPPAQPPAAAPAKGSTATMGMTSGGGTPLPGAETFAQMTNRNINKMSPRELATYGRQHEQDTIEAIKRFGLPIPD